MKMPPEAIIPVAPETTPVTVPSTDTSVPEDSSVDWGTIATEAEIPEEELEASSVLDVEMPVPAKAPTGAAIAPPVVSPAPVPVSAQPVITAPSPAPQDPSTQAQPQAPAATAPQTSTADITKRREELLTELEQSYAMTEEEGVELLRAPEAVLPKLAAQLQLNIMEQLIQQVAGMMPRVIDNHLGQQKANTANRESFFKEWPDLNKPEYTDTLTRIAMTYRQQNPAAPRERAIKEIGAIAAMTLGVVPTGMIQPTVPVIAQPPQFRPAMPGGGGRPAVAADSNPFTALANEWGDE
jgi:hypothetical protein